MMILLSKVKITGFDLKKLLRYETSKDHCLINKVSHEWEEAAIVHSAI